MAYDPNRGEKLCNAWCSLFVCLIVTGAITALSIGYHNSYFSGPVTSWSNPKSASLGTRLCSRGGPREHVCYHVYVESKYQVGDQTYGHAYTTKSVSEKSEADKFLIYYQSASRGRAVYYDRNNPARSSLVPLPGKAFLFLMGLVFSSIGAFFVIMWLCSAWWCGCGGPGSAVLDCLMDSSKKNQEKGNSPAGDREMDSLSEDSLSEDVGEIHIV